MHFFLRKFLGIGLAIGLATFSLSARTTMTLGSLPLWFEGSHGQTGASTQFSARGADSEFLIAPTQAKFILHKTDGSTASCTMSFVGAAASATISGNTELAGKINYLLGSNPAQWQTCVPTYAKVSVEQLYPGVSVVYYGTGRQLEYDFNLAAGVNPGAVVLRFDGAEKISVNPQGELVISLPGGDIIQHQPLVYQNTGEVRHEVSSGYKILDARTATFAIGSYNHSQPLVIDPVLSYSTYFGGNAGEAALSVAVDASGSIYIAGKTFSTAFSNNIPWSTTNAYQTNFHGGTLTGDAFVAKFNNLGIIGTNLIYLTYLGGSGDDGADGVAIDSQGDAYVGGYTSSSNFPTANILSGSGLSTNISGTFLSGFGYRTDAFIAELNTNGSGLIYSGLLGGTESDAVLGIAVDTNSGTAFVTGYTYSTNFPCTTNALSKKLSCPYSQYYNANAFVAEIAPNGTNLNYSTYFGGTNGGVGKIDSGQAISFNNRTVFVAGYTSSTNFPIANAITNYNFLNGSTNQINPASDAFVAAFTNNDTSATNLVLLYSTFLGGTNNDGANGIAADASGNAYVVGWTVSTNFPYTNALASFSNSSPSFVHTNIAGFAFATNAFLTQIKWNGTSASIGFSAMFGGVGLDVANGVALDAANNIYVVGSASSTNFPVTTNNLLGSLRATNSGGSDVFVTAFKSDGSALLYSTYLGGSADDFGYGIAVDAAGNAYVTGQTLSTNFPSFNARQTTLNGTNDAFLIKIMPASPTPLLTAGLSGTNVLVSWLPLGEESPALFGLITTTNLLTTNAWPFTTNSPVFTNNNGAYYYKFSPTNPAQFFRLRQY